MAVYYGDGSKLDYDKKRMVSGLIPRDRLFHIQEKMRSKTHTPLTKLIAMPQRRFTGSHYADGWSLVYFFFDGPEKKKGRAFMSYRSVAPSSNAAGLSGYFGAGQGECRI